MKHGLIDRRDFEDWLIENCTGNMAQLVKGYIKEQPIVDAVPVVQGEWISEYDGFEWDVRCSVCGEETLIKEGGSHDHAYSHYCPNCGAKMDGEEFEEPTINPCRGCEDYDGYGGCKSNGGCGRTEMDGKEKSDE